MDVKFEYLELLPKILNKLEIIEKYLQENYSKRWMNINELSQYIGYSKDRLYKIKSNDWNENLHYYKRSGKLIFDRIAIDKWIMGDPEYIIKETDKDKVNRIVDSLLEDIKQIHK